MNTPTDIDQFPRLMAATILKAAQTEIDRQKEAGKREQADVALDAFLNGASFALRHLSVGPEDPEAELTAFNENQITPRMLAKSIVVACTLCGLKPNDQ